MTETPETDFHVQKAIMIAQFVTARKILERYSKLFEDKDFRNMTGDGEATKSQIDDNKKAIKNTIATLNMYERNAKLITDPLQLQKASALRNDFRIISQGRSMEITPQSSPRELLADLVTQNQDMLKKSKAFQLLTIQN